MINNHAKEGDGDEDDEDKDDDEEKIEDEEKKRFTKDKDMCKPMTGWWKQKKLTDFTENAAVKDAGVKAD